MSGGEPWGFPVTAPATGPRAGPVDDAARRAFWATTITNTCPECHHPTDSHRLEEIAVNPPGSRVARLSGRSIYEVECVVCQRQCCRTYG